jgi:hypothetical protein
MIGIKFNHSWADSAIKYTAQKLQNPSSFRELLEQIVRIRIFQWEEIESVAHAQVVQVLEQALPHPGQLKLDFTVQFDLSYGKDSHSLGLVEPDTRCHSPPRAMDCTCSCYPLNGRCSRLSASGLLAVRDSRCSSIYGSG